jgi:hypothetical protein
MKKTKKTKKTTRSEKRGEHPMLRTSAEPIDMRTAEDVRELLSDTVRRVSSGEMSAQVGSTIASLSHGLLKALELGGGELESGPQIEKDPADDPRVALRVTSKNGTFDIRRPEGWKPPEEREKEVN